MPSPYNNNYYGQGSGALRVYTHTIDTFAGDVNEVQTITTTATSGQTLGGGFHLTYRGNRTALIDFAVEPAELERAIESSFHWVGDVIVTRSLTDSQVQSDCVTAASYCFVLRNLPAAALLLFAVDN